MKAALAVGSLMALGAALSSSIAYVVMMIVSQETKV